MHSFNYGFLYFRQCKFSLFYLIQSHWLYMQCILYTVKYTVYIVYCTVYISQCKQYIAQWNYTQYIAQFTVYIVHFNIRLFVSFTYLRIFHYTYVTHSHTHGHTLITLHTSTHPWVYGCIYSLTLTHSLTRTHTPQ